MEKKEKTKKTEKKTATIKKTPVKAAEKPVEKKTAAKRLIAKKEVAKKVKETVAAEKPIEKKPVVQKPKIPSPKPQPPKEIVYQAVGRRKTATARVKLIVNKQNKDKTFTVNGRAVEVYFPLSQYQRLYLEPLRTTNTINRFDISVKVVGSGLVGQLGAMINALAKALVKVDPERFKKILRKKGFMTRDPRAKERKKVGLMGARRVKQSPKR